MAEVSLRSKHKLTSALCIRLRGPIQRVWFLSDKILPGHEVSEKTVETPTVGRKCTTCTAGPSSLKMKRMPMLAGQMKDVNTHTVFRVSSRDQFLLSPKSRI